MTDGYLLNLRTFRKVRDDKAQTLKPLEEAAEAFGAWRQHDGVRGYVYLPTKRNARGRLIDECPDTVQATVDPENRTTCPHGRPNGCARADRQRGWMRHRVRMGLEQRPGWRLDQNRFEGV